MLRLQTRNGTETGVFEYDDGWLKHPQRFSIEPALALTPGTLAGSKNRSIPGSIGDSAADTWGRRLMLRAERRNAYHRRIIGSWLALKRAHVQAPRRGCSRRNDHRRSPLRNPRPLSSRRHRHRRSIRGRGAARASSEIRGPDERGHATVDLFGTFCTASVPAVVLSNAMPAGEADSAAVFPFPTYRNPNACDRGPASQAWFRELQGIAMKRLEGRPRIEHALRAARTQRSPTYSEVPMPSRVLFVDRHAASPTVSSPRNGALR